MRLFDPNLFVEPTRSIPKVPPPSDVRVCFTMEELKALTANFYAHNFEFDCTRSDDARSLEFLKRDTNILLKLLYAIEEASPPAKANKEKADG